MSDAGVLIDVLARRIAAAVEFCEDEHWQGRVSAESVLAILQGDAPTLPTRGLRQTIADVLDLRSSDDGTLLVNNLQARDILRRAIS